MKNAKKLNLNNLKVESFVTSLGSNDSQTIKGGITSSGGCIVGAAAVVAVTIFACPAIYQAAKDLNNVAKEVEAATGGDKEVTK